MEDIYILGVHDGHCSTACLLKNGKIVACASEERFVYKKNEWGMPLNSIEYCLTEAKISSKDLNKVVLASKFMSPIIRGSSENTITTTKGSKFVYLGMQKIRKILLNSPEIHNFFYKKIQPKLAKKSAEERKKYLLNLLKIPKNRLIVQDHHESHAYSAMYSSDFLNKNKDFLVLTLDGEGDGLCATVNTVKGGKLTRISSTINSYSLGLLYAIITKYLGMKVLEHEYKVMGLAPYANEYYTKKTYDKLKDFIWLEGLEFRSSYHSRKYYNFIKEKLSEHRFDGIAGGIQKFTEELIIKWVKRCIKKTRINNIVFAGGVFMNVKVNMKITEIKEIGDVFFMPGCGDESLAIGSAYYGYEIYCNQIKKPVNISPLGHLYLGPDVNEKEIKNFFGKNRKYVVRKLKNVPKEVAKLLSKGEIIARCSGRMEWGARSLGNRSILADPSNPKIVRRINEAIKSRDFWMPFAPVILKEYEKKYIKNEKNINVPYMILAFNSTQEGREKLSSAIHPYDATVRPQILEKKWNKEYYNIIKEFSKIKKIGALLNTSFNLHGYPIVKGVKEAFHVMENSELKYLLINDFLITKKKNSLIKNPSAITQI